MFFSSVYRNNSAVLSLEFFPPKSESSLLDTISMIADLATLAPHFMTVTYGAGGGTRAFTRRLVSFISEDLSIPAVAHLTCMGHTVAEIDQILEDYHAAGVTNILALRGDLPKDYVPNSSHKGAFENARELTAHITSKNRSFSIAVAGYPETHREAKSAQADIDYLKEKVDAGAEIIITQLFFDNQHYYRFRENAIRAGINVPIVPGIMPISNVSQIKRFTEMCGASVPDNLAKQLDAIGEDYVAVNRFGIEYAVCQCQDLLAQGAPGIHLYTLNKSLQVRPIVRALQINTSVEKHCNPSIARGI